MKRFVTMTMTMMTNALLAGEALAQPEENVPVSPAPVAPPSPNVDAPRAAAEPPAVGGGGRWVFDLFGGQLTTTSGLGGLGALPALGVTAGPFLFSSSSVESGGGKTGTTTLALSPSFDTFVSDRFSVGGRATVGVLRSSYEVDLPDGPWEKSTLGYTLGIAPRVGYALPLSSSFAFWPRVGGGYEVARQPSGGLGGRTLEQVVLAEANLGVALRLAKHALLDLGPVVAYRYTNREGSSLGLGIPSTGTTQSTSVSMRAALRVDF